MSAAHVALALARAKRDINAFFDKHRRDIVEHARGEQGLPGEPGEPGRAGAEGRGINWRGKFRSGDTYYGPEENPARTNHHDAVEDKGSSWICLATTTTRPSARSADWDLLAAKGSPGKAGARGLRGFTGASGGAPAAASGLVPTTIVEGSTWTVPDGYQVLYHLPQTVDGEIVIDGYLVEV